MPRSKTIGKARKGKRTVKNSMTAPRQIELQERRREALEYRKQGYTFQAIGAAMSIDPSTAHDYVVRALSEITEEDAKLVLKMELQRLDDYQSSTYANAAEGDIPAIDLNLRISDRRARLLGLYPDSKQSAGVTITGGSESSTGVDEIRVSFVKPDRKTNGHAEDDD